MIKISRLIFDYPGRRALDDVSLEVQAGSVTALVGPNGAGKTTLMRCIAGLETPLSGSIEVAGMDVIEEPRAVHRSMGYLSDFFGLYQELTVARCLEYAAASQGLSAAAIPQAIRDTARRLQLTDRLQQLSGSLSRGLRQRVAVGQAIIHQPKVLLLDEPASGLDPEARSELAALFRQLQADGMTLLVSSHILAELDEYSTHLLVLRDGRVLENRALSVPAHADEVRILALQLAAPDARLAGWLKAQPGLVCEDVEHDRAEIHFRGDATAQAGLLVALVQAGFAVSSFAEHKESLQQSYLRSVAAHLEKTS
ncbi:MAG: ABC transporter ATP-binding protein [Methylobacillus sp.]|jgi:ABC-2 type transport system ATP-binding protein|nr:ABC transporter ATP-binding protein [Methylobacillus sp.]